MDKIIASLQLLLDAQVPIETVNDLWRALWMAQAHWLHQPKKTDVFYSAICTKEKHSWVSSCQILLLILKCYLNASLVGIL